MKCTITTQWKFWLFWIKFNLGITSGELGRIMLHITFFRSTPSDKGWIYNGDFDEAASLELLLHGFHVLHLFWWE